ncbi:MAG: serine aminopeptidase domain-containing protein [Amylibacter sp.]
MERKKFTNALGEDFSYLVHESTKSNLNFVFFHATGFNSETYQILFEKLKNQFDNQINIYALDQRGHGLSKAKSDHKQLKSWDVFVEDGKEFIDSITRTCYMLGTLYGFYNCCENSFSRS